MSLAAIVRNWEVAGRRAHAIVIHEEAIERREVTIARHRPAVVSLRGATHCPEGATDLFGEATDLFGRAAEFMEEVIDFTEESPTSKASDRLSSVRGTIAFMVMRNSSCSRSVSLTQPQFVLRIRRVMLDG